MVAVAQISRLGRLGDAGSVAQIEDLFVTTNYASITVAGGTQYVPILVAPFPLRIMGITGINLGGALTLDGSNYWSFRPRRYRVTTDFSTQYQDVIGSSGTNFALNVSKLQGEPWAFEPKATYDDTYRLLRTGDALVMRIASSGSPTDMTNVLFTVRYEPR